MRDAVRGRMTAFRRPIGLPHAIAMVIGTIIGGPSAGMRRRYSA
ncbi:MAG: hypothetical protein ABI877_17290 [Gemmatimonadaceae bacterium]